MYVELPRKAHSGYPFLGSEDKCQKTEDIIVARLKFYRLLLSNSQKVLASISVLIFKTRCLYRSYHFIL